ncbi:MAG: FadR/GntR family transcriptional regulator, partial [Candidatus Eiseniibacteriota bacterium]
MSETTDRFERISATPAYKLFADAIESEIISGRLRPGEPLGTEAELVKQFGVNRSTVREGIRLLEQGGLVRRDSSRRLSVALPQFHLDRLASRMSRALVLHEVTFRELWDAAMALALAALDQAMTYATVEAIAALDANIAHTVEAAGDAALVAELDTEFHNLIGKASENRVLQLALEPSNLLIFPTTEPILTRIPEGTPRLIEAHRQIVDALRRRDREAGRLWVERHLKDWRRGFERVGNALDQPVDHFYMQSVRR